MERADWLDPINRIIWQKAFKAQAATMTLRDGRVFTIDYRRVKVTSLDVRKSGVKLKAWVFPKHGECAPCGWFPVDDVIDITWIQNGIPQSQQERERAVVVGGSE